MSTSSEDDEMQPRAFAVDGELPPEAGPPMTGLDYLRHVRWETRRIPKVVVAAASASASSATKTTPRSLPDLIAGTAIDESCDACVAPSRAWEAAFVESFAKLRARFDRAKKQKQQQHGESTTTTLPAARAREAWQRMCGALPGTEEGTLLPTVAALAATDHATVCAALGHLSAAFVGDSGALFGGTTDAARQLVLLSWIFALMVALDGPPLGADEAAALRVVLRSCCARRATIRSLADPLAASINVVIAAAGVFFHQLGRC